MKKYFLETKRLGFAKWGENDRELAIGLWGDPEVTRLIDARGKLSEEQVMERLRRELNNDEQYGVQYWPIFLLETGEHVGCCGLRPYEPAEDILETGFHIKRAFWGQGFAYEAAQGVIGYAFEVLGAKALFAGHNPQNTASGRLLAKLGFDYTHDEFYPATGLMHPSYLLASDKYKTRP